MSESVFSPRCMHGIEPDDICGDCLVASRYPESLVDSRYRETLMALEARAVKAESDAASWKGAAEVFEYDLSEERKEVGGLKQQLADMKSRLCNHCLREVDDPTAAKLEVQLLKEQLKLAAEERAETLKLLVIADNALLSIQDWAERHQNPTVGNTAKRALEAIRK
jgi:hypothetical protein